MVLVDDLRYPDVALTVYLKVAALADNKTGECVASAEKIATYCGISVSSAKRGAAAHAGADP